MLMTTTEDLNNHLRTLPYTIRAVNYRKLCLDLISFADFEHVQLITDGRGSFGEVVKAVRKQQDHSTPEKVFALKFFGYGVHLPDPNWIDKEVENMLALLNVQGAVQIEGVFMDTSEGHISHLKRKEHRHAFPVIVMELLNGGDLFTKISMHVKSNGAHGFTERLAANMFQQILKTIHDIHDKGEMINRDLKAENIAFDSEGKIKILDFGLAVPLCPSQDYTCFSIADGTPAYLPPDIVRIKLGRGRVYPYRRSGDMWQAGCILYHILHGKPPFILRGTTHVHVEQLNHSIVQPAVPMSERLSANAQHLLASLLAQDHKSRPTALQVLSHPWIVHNCAEAPVPAQACEGLQRMPSEYSLGIDGSEYAGNIAVSRCRRELKKQLTRKVEDFKTRRNFLQSLMTRKRKRLTSDTCSDSSSSSSPCSGTAGNFVGDASGSCEHSAGVAVDLDLDEDGLAELRRKCEEGASAAGGAGLTKDQFLALLQGTSFLNHIDDSDYDELFRAVDEDGNGTVDAEEFLNTLSSLRFDVAKDFASQSNAKIIFDIFNHLKARKFIDKIDFDDSMRAVLNKSPDLWTAAVCDQIFLEIDANKDTKISEEEFEAFLSVVLAEASSSSGLTKLTACHLGGIASAAAVVAPPPPAPPALTLAPAPLPRAGCHVTASATSCCEEDKDNDDHHDHHHDDHHQDHHHKRPHM